MSASRPWRKSTISPSARNSMNMMVRIQRYIVITDNDFPIATARMYPLDAHSMMIGRVVVLPEYRRLGIGTMVVNECETWAEELGFSKTVVESRDNKIAFYEQMLYEVCGEAVDGETFRCVRMEKQL